MVSCSGIDHFLVFFIIPMVTSLFFSLTVWDLKSFTFCGLDNFKTFFWRAFFKHICKKYTDLCFYDKRIEGCDCIFYCSVSYQQDQNKEFSQGTGIFSEPCKCGCDRYCI